MEYIFKWFWNGTLSFGEGRGEANNSISGGTLNQIGTGAGYSGYNFIGGGTHNTIFSDCSSIVGGHGNNINAGFNNAHIVGSGINVTAGTGSANTLHVNCLWANSVPRVVRSL